MSRSKQRQPVSTAVFIEKINMRKVLKADYPSDAQSLAFTSSIVCGLAHESSASFDEAYLRFVKRHFRHMQLWFCNFRHINPQDREDAVQDFFLSIRRKIRSKRSREVLKSFLDAPDGGKLLFRKWLWRVAKHSSVDFMRSRKNKCEPLIDGALDDGGFSRLLSEQIELLFREDFNTMLVQIGSHVIGTEVGRSGTVSAKDWEIFVLGYWVSRSDLAKRFGKTERAVDQARHRARKGLSKIRSQMIDQFGLASPFAFADRPSTSEYESPCP